MRNKTIFQRVRAILLALLLFTNSVPVNVFAGDDIDLTQQEGQRGIHFEDTDGNAISSTEVSLSVNIDGVEVDISPLYDEDQEAFLVEQPSGTVIGYTVYGNVQGEVTLDDGIVTVTIDNTRMSPGLTCDEITLELGTSVDINDLVTTDPDYDGDLSVTSNETFISIDGTTVSPLQIGEGYITIVASETNSFTDASVIVPITVTKKDLGEIPFEHISWNVPEKTYDTTDEISADGSITLTTGTVIPFVAQLETESANAGTWASTVTSYQYESDLYTFTLPERGPEVTILKVDAEVTLDDKTVTYGDDNWNALTAGNVPAWEEWIHADAVASEAVLAELHSIDPWTYLDVDVKADNYYPGVVENAIIASVADNNTNFNFTVSKNTDVTVINERLDDESVWNQIEADGGTRVYIGDKVWAATGGFVHYKFKEPGLYDLILFNTGKEEENGFTVPDSINGTVQLANSKDDSIRSDSDPDEEGAQPAGIPEDAVIIDNNAPVISFGDAGLYDGHAAVFSKEPYTAEATATDDGSGVSAFSYGILSVTSEEDAQEKSSLTSTVETAEEDGMYIITADATDHVENASHAASNVIVVDSKEPSVSISGLEDKIYSEDVPFTVMANDDGSGIAGISVTASNGVLENTIFESNYEDTSIDKLTAERTENVVLPSDFNSNTITVTAVVTDRAGNTASASEIVKIDSTKPSITVSYDNNEPRNGHYFNTDRTMTVAFKERNYNPSLAGIVFTVNGTEYNYTMDGQQELPAGITLTESSDSEEDSYTDERLNSYVFVFGGDGFDQDYKVEPYITDEAGNQAKEPDYGNSNPANEFTIDRVMPVISAAFTSDGEEFIPGTEETAYTQKDVTAVLTVNERNFSEDGFTVSATADNENGDVPVSTDGTWDGQAYTILFTDDANYQLVSAFTDLAGNSFSLNQQLFTIDGTTPTGSLITHNGDETEESDALNATVSFGIFANKTVSFSYTSDDITSGVSTVMYAVHKPGAEEKNTFSVPASDLEELNWVLWDENAVVSPDSQAVLYLRIIDRAGNITYINSQGVIAESTSPNRPTISIDTPTTNDYYKDDVPFSITVTDPKKGGTYSGLKSVKWEVRKDGTVTQRGNYDDELTDPAARVQTITHSETVDSSKNNSNNVTIYVTAEDYSGNTRTASKHLSIDITQPRITVSFDNNEPRNRRYFKSSRTMTVSIQERNYEPEKTLVNLTVDGISQTVPIDELSGTGISVVQRRQDSQAGDYTDERINTYVFSFGADGNTDSDYNISFRTTDTAGNKNEDVDYGNSVAPKAFVIDEVSPVLRYVFTNSAGTAFTAGSKKNPYYDKTSVSEAIRVTERNHRDSNLNLSVSASNLEGDDITVSTDGVWSHDENVHLFTANTYMEDANYRTSATYEDLAGNPASLSDRYFTVDGTPPTGTVTTETKGEEKTSSSYIRKIRFGTFTNQNVRVTQTNRDETSGVDSVSYFIYIPTAETTEFDNPTTDALRNVDWIKWPGTVTISPNMQAVVFLRIIDKAGNIRYISSKDGIIADSVSPGPNITITTATEREVYNGDVPFRIDVTDPTGIYSGLKSVRWYVRKDGTITQQGNYNSELTNPRVQTLSHSETVSASSNNSNNVVITVEAEDYAGNTASASKQIKIDATAPLIQVSYDNNSPLNGKYFNRARTMTVRVTERNFDPNTAYFNITVNGQQSRVPLGSLSGTGIRSESGRADSEAGRAAETYTDARTNTYVYSFGADGTTDADYNVTVSATDIAGNNATVSYGDSNPQSEFTIDEISPKLDLSYLNGNNGPVDIPVAGQPLYYDRKSVTATVNVEERNFAENGLVLTTTSRQLKGTASPFNAGGEWSGSGNTHNYRVRTFNEDGIYTIEATFTDLAGNSVSYTQHAFVVDKTNPVGSVTISGDAETTFNSINELIAFRLFTSRTLRVTQTNSDETSGVASVQYYLYTPDVETRGTFRGLSADQLANVSWKNWPESLVLAPNMQTVVYARIIDNAGNITYMNAKDGIVEDNTAPQEPEITITTEKTISNKDVPFTIKVSDPEQGGTYAGLKTVTWSVQKDGTTTQSGSYDGELSDPTMRQKTVEHRETVKAADNDSNNIRIVVDATDYAGNTSHAEKTLSIDVTKPVVEVTYDRNDPKNGMYFDGPRIATVRVIERNFDPSAVKMESGGKHTAGTWTDNGDEHVCTVKFEEDNDYTFSVNVTDAAGNVSDYDRQDHFVIDTERPVIAVTFDENNEDDSIYYNSNRTAVILVRDINFDEQYFTYDIAAELAGKKVENTPKTTSWLHNGTLHSAMLTFEEDADYAFELSCEDLAGNKAEPLKQSKFVIDKTKPSIRFKEVANHSANKGEVAPLIEYTDINYSKDGVHVILSGASHDETEVLGERTDDIMRGTFQMADFAHEKSVDDLYTLTAEITDMAGNKASSSIEFSVNRFGSVYTFSDETKTFLDEYYRQQPEDLTIYETNVDGLTNIGVTLGRNGETQRLEADKDYEAVKQDTENGWTVWKYGLKSSNFEKEGLYEVRIESVDEAGNEQDNALKDKPIAFAIDRTAPSIVVTGIDDAARYVENSVDVGISLSDNLAMERADVYVNGKKAQTYDTAAIGSISGNISFTLPAADNWQTVEVFAYDKAGNESRSESKTVFVTTNRFRQFMENKPLLYGTIGGAAGAAGIAVFLLLKRRKRQQKV